MQTLSEPEETMNDLKKRMYINIKIVKMRIGTLLNQDCV